MQQFIDREYATKVDPDIYMPRNWYLPHFGLRNPNKPNKIRLVFDAAAKTRGVSSNNQWDARPDLLESLPGVSIRFRQYRVAFKGAILNMFLKVKIREKNRDAQRFLWRGRDRHRKPEELEMDVLLFEAPPPPCSAIYIKNKNADTFKIKGSKAHEVIKRNSYVDDQLGSCKTVGEAKKSVSEIAKKKMQWAAFKCTLGPAKSRLIS